MSKRARRNRQRPTSPHAEDELRKAHEAVLTLSAALLQDSFNSNREGVPGTPSTPVKKQKCESVTAAGVACRAWARSGNTMCIYHDPAYRAQLAASGARGGQNSRPTLAEQTFVPELNITDHESLRAAASGLAGLLLVGEVGPTRAKLLVRLLTVVERSLGPG